MESVRPSRHSSGIFDPLEFDLRVTELNRLTATEVQLKSTWRRYRLDVLDPANGAWTGSPFGGEFRSVHVADAVRPMATAM